MVLSSQADASLLASALNAIAQIIPVWPRRQIGSAAGSSRDKSHSRTTVSPLPVASHRLSGLIARLVTDSSCPARTSESWDGSDADRFHNRAVRSPLAVTSQRPSGLIFRS